MSIKTTKTTKTTINYLYKIITQNNIKFGHSQFVISKNANLFIFKAKNDMEFFDVIDLKNILYKIFLYIKTLYLINKKSNNFLFVTTTPVFSEIMKNAALSSRTIYHIDRWTCGTITRRIDKWKQNDFINITYLKKNKNIFNFCFFFFRYKKLFKDTSTLDPLIGLFIPDVHNNLMIIKEAKIENIPLIGIVNSNTSIDISYPIFGNASSLFSVFFFSHLIAYWIKTHIRFIYEKRNNLIKWKSNNKKKSVRNLQKTNAYILFQKRYIRMTYKFRKFFQNELLYNVYIEKVDAINIENYRKKLQIQRKTRALQENFIFSPTKLWNLTTRWIMLTRSLQHNLVGGLAFTNNFLGKHFWLFFRKFLINPVQKTQKKDTFLKSFKWSKQLKRNWKWLNFGKKKLLKKSKFLRHKKKSNKRSILITKSSVKSHLKQNKTNSYQNIISKTLGVSWKKNNEKTKYNKDLKRSSNKKNLRFFKSKK